MTSLKKAYIIATRERNKKSIVFSKDLEKDFCVEVSSKFSGIVEKEAFVLNERGKVHLDL